MPSSQTTKHDTFRERKIDDSRIYIYIITLCADYTKTNLNRTAPKENGRPLFK
jgi:hypothetical protein